MSNKGVTSLIKEIMMSAEGQPITLDYLEKELGVERGPIGQAVSSLIERKVGFTRVRQGVYRYDAPRRKTTPNNNGARAKTVKPVTTDAPVKGQPFTGIVLAVMEDGCPLVLADGKVYKMKELG